MAKLSVSGATKELETLIQGLQAERQQHVEAIESIDATFARFGIKLAAKARKTRRRANGAKNKSGENTALGNPKFNTWADTFSSWPKLAEKAGISYPTAIRLRDGKTPRGPVRKQIEKASKGAVPADSWDS